LAQLRGAIQSQRMAVAALNDADYEGRSLIPTDFSLWSRAQQAVDGVHEMTARSPF
jgi:hypothetical protein